MRLKEIVSADFRKNEATLFEENAAEKKWKLKPGEVICFMSLNKSQLVFVHAPADEGENRAGNMRRVFHSERLRITGGQFNPLMLANYANEVGIQLEGIKRFEQHYVALVKEEHKTNGHRK